MTCQPNWLWTGSVGTPTVAPSAPAVKSGSNCVWKVPDRLAGVAVGRRPARRRSSPRRARSSARLGHLGEVRARLELVQHGLGLGLRLERMWLTHSAPVAGRVVGVLRLEVLGRRRGELASATRRRPRRATTSSCMACGRSWRRSGWLEIWAWMASIGSWRRLESPRSSRRSSAAFQVITWDSQPRAVSPVDGDVGPAGQVEQAGVGGERLAGRARSPTGGWRCRSPSPPAPAPCCRTTGRAERRHSRAEERATPRPSVPTAVRITRGDPTPAAAAASRRPPSVSGNSSPRTASRWRVGSWPRRNGQHELVQRLLVDGVAGHPAQAHRLARPQLDRARGGR